MCAQSEGVEDKQKKIFSTKELDHTMLVLWYDTILVEQRVKYICFFEIIVAIFWMIPIIDFFWLFHGFSFLYFQIKLEIVYFDVLGKVTDLAIVARLKLGL